MKSRRKAEAGLTLVELMVTMIIAALVASSTYMFFVGQQRIYDTQTKMLNTQQNLWAAMETITRNIRAAGTGMVGCVRPDTDGDGPDNGDPPPIGNVMPATGLRTHAGNVFMRIAPLWIQNGAAGAPDRLTVAYGTGTSGNFVDANLGATIPAGSTLTPIRTLPGLTTVFRPNEFIVVLHSGATPASGNWDRGCTLFQITGINAATDTLQTAPASPWNPSVDVAPMVPWAYQAGDQGGVRNFGQLTWIQFAIDNTGPAPVLTMNRLDGPGGPQILAEGIEDLQIAYGCDIPPVGSTAGDGDITEGPNAGARLNDEWYLNVAGDNVNLRCNRPHAVRVTVIARTLTADDTLSGLVTNFKPAVEDGLVGVPDQFRHRVLTTTVWPRN